MFMPTQWHAPVLRAGFRHIQYSIFALEKQAFFAEIRYKDSVGGAGNFGKMRKPVKNLTGFAPCFAQITEKAEKVVTNFTQYAILKK